MKEVEDFISQHEDGEFEIFLETTVMEELFQPNLETEERGSERQQHLK